MFALMICAMICSVCIFAILTCNGLKLMLSSGCHNPIKNGGADQTDEFARGEDGFDFEQIISLQMTILNAVDVLFKISMALLALNIISQCGSEPEGDGHIGHTDGGTY